MSGKVLTMYLMDGDPIGRIKCKIANWTGIVYKIPRISIDNCDDIQELTQSGVYLLFGTDKDENTVVYIGQAGNRKNGRG
ncbi:MAG TPA: methionine sulfoxide reductase, partial [Clostridia bacterium]|nr:methionine sulfoxide reductase [Clostridia bacterium]